MKTRIIALFAGLLAVLPMTSAWGYGYSYTATLTGKAEPTGAGIVYASETLDGAKAKSNAESYTKSGSTEDDGDVSGTLYAYAVPNVGYKFDGWMDADGSDGDTCSVSFTCTSKSKTSSKTVTARFSPLDYAPFSVTLLPLDPVWTGSVKAELVAPSTGDLANRTNIAIVNFTAMEDKKKISSDGNYYKYYRWYRQVGDSRETIVEAPKMTFTESYTADVTIGVEFIRIETVNLTCLAPKNGVYSFTASGGSEQAVGADGLTVSIPDVAIGTLSASPDFGYEISRWYKIVEGETTYFGEGKTSVDVEFGKHASVGVEFVARPRVAVNIDDDSAADVSVSVKNDFEETATGFVGFDSATATFTTSAQADKQPRWWCRASGAAEKKYLSYERSFTWTFSDDVEIGVDFVTTDNSLATVLNDVTSGTVVLEKDMEVPYGTTLTIPQGVEVEIPSGVALFVDGTLNVEGSIVGAGALLTCGKLLTQTGDGMSPRNPYDTVRYWVTTEVTANAGVTSGKWVGISSNHVTVIRGDGVAIRKEYAQAPQYITCTVDSRVAANHVTAISDMSTSASMLTSLTTPPSDVAKLLNEDAAASIHMLLSDGVDINGPQDSNKNKRVYFQGLIDCAGHSMTVKAASANGFTSSQFTAVFVNGKSVSLTPSKALQNSHMRFCNCDSITMSNIGDHAYCQYVDCNLKSISYKSVTSTTYVSKGKAVAKFYGGKYDYPFSLDYDSATDKDYYTEVYAGGFASKPDSKWIATTLQSSHEFYQHDDGYWYLEPKRDPSVASVAFGSGTKKCETLSEAFACLQTSGEVTITMLKNTTLDEPVSVAQGQTLRIVLNGCRITAPKGFVKNNGGTVLIHEEGNLLKIAGVTSTGGPIVESIAGTTDICYGDYVGDFRVDGGIVTMHHGNFNGAFIKGAEGDIDLRGGKFTIGSGADKLIRDGFVAVLRNNTYHVGMAPTPYVIISDYKGIGNHYEMTAMQDDKKSEFLSKCNMARSGFESDAKWYEMSEMNAAYGHFIDMGFIDIVAEFDRDIQVGGLSFSTKIAGFTVDSQNDEVIVANVPTRMLSPRISESSKQISYERFVNDGTEHKWDTLTAGLGDKEGRYAGTICKLSAEVWHFKDTSKKNSYGNPILTDNQYTIFEILSIRFVFGAGDNVAMIREADAPVAFYSTLQGAIDDKDENDGMAIMLCNDCNEDATVGKACTIDTNGFRFDGELTPAEGFDMVENGGVYTFTAKPDNSVARIEDDKYGSLADAVAAANAKGGNVTITLLADVAENVCLNHGVSIETDGWKCAGTVSAAEGCRVDLASGVYTCTRTEVAKVGSAYYVTLAAAVEAASADAEIVLIGDCDECVTVGKVCTIDESETAFSGAVAAADGYSVGKSGKKWIVTAAKSTTAITVAVVEDPERPSEAKNVEIVVDEATVGRLQEQKVDVTTIKIEEKKSDGKDVATVEVDGERVEASVSDGLVSVQIVDSKAKPVADLTETMNGKTFEAAVAEQNTGVYQQTKVIEVKGEKIQVVDEDKTPISVIREKSVEETVMLSVPGTKDRNGNAITFDNMFLTPPEAGDQIKLSDANGGFRYWKFGDGKWNPFGSSSDKKNDGTYELTPGMAFWYTKVTPDRSVSVVAAYEEVTTPILAVPTQEDATEKWNMIVNVNANEAVNLNDIVDAQQPDEVKNDTVIVPVEGGLQRNYTIGKDNKWGYNKAKVVIRNGMKFMVNEWKSDDATIPRGKGFWYVSGGGKPTIDWYRKGTK